MNYKKILNRWKLLDSYIRKEPAFAPMPSSLVIEASNKCTMNCIMCPRDEARAHPCDMSFDLFKNVIDQSKGYTEFIDFTFRAH